jgi:hypothetical protein
MKAAALQITTPDGETMSVTPGLVKRTIEHARSGSAGVPDQYLNTLEWAADWVSQKGMTLPPKGHEFNTLRSWFCFQLQKWKSDTLTEKSLQEFAIHGIDFSQYRALNTGKGERESDEQFVEMLKQWEIQAKTYDLDKTADSKLLAWQKRIFERYIVCGCSKRLLEIEGSLPGFKVGLWRRPVDPVHSPAFLKWWETAQEFRTASITSPSFRGALHPHLPKSLLVWAAKQQADAISKNFPVRQRGELYSLQILYRDDQREINKKREKLLGLARERDLNNLDKGDTDRRLNSFLGAALLARLLHKQSSDMKIMVEFAVGPAEILKMRECAEDFMPIITQKTFLKQLQACRNFYRADQSIFWKIADGDQDLALEIVGMREPVVTAGVMLHNLQLKLERLKIVQNIGFT